MDARGGRARHRSARLAAQARRHDDGQQPPGHAGLVHGRDPAPPRQQQRPRVLRAAAGARQRRPRRRRDQHLPRPRQRPGCYRPRLRAGRPAGLFRPDRGRLEALGAGLGRRVRLLRRPLRLEGADGGQGHPRSRAGSTRCSRRRRTSTSRPTCMRWSTWATRRTRRPASRTSSARWSSSTCWS